MRKLFRIGGNIHRSGYASRTEDDFKHASLDESRIAGAINILTLKIFGYSGWMSHSTLEDDNRQI